MRARACQNDEAARLVTIPGNQLFPNEDAITRLVGAVLLTERRVGRLQEIHDTGIHRSDQRQSNRQAARRGSLTPRPKPPDTA